MVLAVAAILVAAWTIGLVGALVGSELAEHRGAPPRRASTLAFVTAPTRDQPYGPIDVAAVANVVGASVVAIQRPVDDGDVVGESSGTGLIVTADGEIVTNAHVVGDADTVNVRLPGESEPRVGTVVAVDADEDLALVRIEAGGLVPAVFADPDDVLVGDEVVAVGYALDLDGDPSVTRGIVSAIDRTMSTSEGALDGLVQTDAAISSGNSGGPLVNAVGHVVGINTAVAFGDLDTAASNIGFAIGVREVIPELIVLREVVDGGINDEGYLGVSLVGRRDGGSGALVALVEADSPAARAGFRIDDIVVRVDDRPILGEADLVATIRDLDPGDEVILTVVRSGRERGLTVTIAARAD